MRESDVRRAVQVATAIVSDLGLDVDDAIVLHNSNKLALRLLPSDVFARVAPASDQVARFEIELAQQLAAADAPVARLEPRVEPSAYARDDFVVTLWTYYEPATPAQIAPHEYARVLERLHTSMRTIDVTAPHFTDRVAEAQALVARHDRTPALEDADRELLGDRLHSLCRAIGDRGTPEQLLHGEPHPGNVLQTNNGPLFIDLESVAHGPVEFDLAHVPAAISDCYEDADQTIIGECRGLVLAMVTAWRFDRNDEFPDGQRAGRVLLDALRAGPPWPTLDVVM